MKRREEKRGDSLWGKMGYVMRCKRGSGWAVGGGWRGWLGEATGRGGGDFGVELGVLREMKTMIKKQQGRGAYDRY